MILIEIVPTELLEDQSSKQIIEEMDEIKKRIANHSFQINRAGVGTLYAIFALINRRYTDFVFRRFVNTHWNTKTVGLTHLPYAVRRTEYPWAIYNADLNRTNLEILDVGSSISLLPHYLSKHGHQVSVLDIAPIPMKKLGPMMAKWANLPTINYKLGSVLDLPFPDESFDRVFCISTLEHLEEEIVNGKIVNYRKKNLDIKAIAEMLRVLRTGGLLILTLDWSESVPRSYKLDDIYTRLLKPYRRFLLRRSNKPEIDWEKMKKEYIKIFKSSPPYFAIYEGWACGVVLRKGEEGKN